VCPGPSFRDHHCRRHRLRFRSFYHRASSASSSHRLRSFVTPSGLVRRGRGGGSCGRKAAGSCGSLDSADAYRRFRSLLF
jgi:hypothetical protein